MMNNRKNKNTKAGANKSKIMNRVGKIDARQKLIQKRQEIGDARERLGQIAKQADARLKLKRNKLPSLMENPIAARISFTGQNDAKFTKTINNINGVRNKNKPSVILKRTISSNNSSKFDFNNKSLKMRIGNIGGKNNSVDTPMNPARKYPLSNPNVITIKNQLAKNNRSQKARPLRNQRVRTNSNMRQNKMTKMNQSLQQKKKSSSLAVNPLLFDNSVGNMSVWSPNLSDIGLTANSLNENWSPYALSRNGGSRKRFRLRHDDEDEYVPTPPQKLRNLDVLMRLEQQQRQMQEQPFGYKLIVSNLHPIVSDEDIEELFRTIGPLYSSRLIRQGLAEVEFIHEKDAYRAIDVYHKRQLDGRPMNIEFSSKSSNFSGTSFGNDGNFYDAVSSLNRKPIPLLSSPNSNDLQGGSRYSSSLLGRPSQRHDVSPDLNAIHHALFSQRHIPIPSIGMKYSQRQSMRGGGRY